MLLLLPCKASPAANAHKPDCTSCQIHLRTACQQHRHGILMYTARLVRNCVRLNSYLGTSAAAIEIKLSAGPSRSDCCGRGMHAINAGTATTSILVPYRPLVSHRLQHVDVAATSDVQPAHHVITRTKTCRHHKPSAVKQACRSHLNPQQ